MTSAHIVAPFAANSCCVCFVAGKPGGGSLCVVTSQADAPPGVAKDERGRAEACVQAAGGCGRGATHSDL
ncbi:MAG: hypothetical protein U9N09_10030 [Euryarchaeota archaeon]|nr:hypothetical protein [Euryarchaeota archaeon]